MSKLCFYILRISDRLLSLAAHTTSSYSHALHHKAQTLAKRISVTCFTRAHDLQSGRYSGGARRRCSPPLCRTGPCKTRLPTWVRRSSRYSLGAHNRILVYEMPFGIATALG